MERMTGFSNKRIAPGMITMPLTMLLLLGACQHEPMVIPGEELTGNPGGGWGAEPEPIDTCDPDVAYFEQDVLPIFVQFCTMSGCHNVPTEQNDDIVLTNHANITNNDWYDDIWEALTEDPGDDDHMPPDTMNQLSADQLQTIQTWMAQGAQNNSCESGCVTTVVTYAGTIRPIIQSRCQGCHSGTNPQGGLDFSTWNDLNAVAGDGRLMSAIQQQAGVAPMPPSGPTLNQCRIDQFLAWVQDGAPNN